jgi:hypothetical protein
VKGSTVQVLPYRLPFQPPACFEGVTMLGYVKEVHNSLLSSLAFSYPNAVFLLGGRGPGVGGFVFLGYYY